MKCVAITQEGGGELGGEIKVKILLLKTDCLCLVKEMTHYVLHKYGGVVLEIRMLKTN